MTDTIFGLRPRDAYHFHLPFFFSALCLVFPRLRYSLRAFDFVDLENLRICA